MSVLVVAEQNETGIQPATRHTIAAACELNTDIHLLLAGKGDVESASRIEGVVKVLVASDEQYNHALAENLAPLVVKLACDYSHILAPATVSYTHLTLPTSDLV